MATEWRWVTTSQRPVHVLDTGPPHQGGPTLLVVPGLGALGYLAPLTRTCGAWARALLLDVPGFGHAATSRCPARLDDVVEVVTAVLDEAIEGPAILCGHSTGAQVALRVALARPGAIRALGLLGPTFPPALRRWPRLAAAAAATVAGEADRLRLAAGTVPEYARGRAGIGRLLHTALADAPEQHIAALAVPLLVLRGRRDAVCPASWASRLAGQARDGVHLTIPGGHNTVFSHASLVARLLGGWAGGRAGGASSARSGRAHPYARGDADGS